jgi:hypothetical protein
LISVRRPLTFVAARPIVSIVANTSLLPVGHG